MPRFLSCFSFVVPLLRAIALQNTKDSGVQDYKPMEILTRIVEGGTNVSVECYSCEIYSLQWTYKTRNSNYKDIAKGGDMIRTKIHGHKEGWYRLSLNEADCIYGLILPTIEIEVAGLFSCWKGSVELRKTNLIVINNYTICTTTPEPSQFVNVFLRESYPATINCSFKYSSDESCIVTPIWTDLTGYRDFTIPGNDFEAKTNDRHAWIHFHAGADVANATQFNLSFSFNCSSFSNNSLDARQQGRYDFGPLEYIVIVERSKSTVMIPVLLTILAVLGLFVAAASYLMKKRNKFCFATQHPPETIDENIDLPKGPPETSYGDRYLKIKKDLNDKDIAVYDGLDDGYDVIRDLDD